MWFSDACTPRMAGACNPVRCAADGLTIACRPQRSRAEVVAIAGTIKLLHGLPSSSVPHCVGISAARVRPRAWPIRTIHSSSKLLSRSYWRSVQRGGNRLRVNVQLIDAETGNHLWAERFDKPVADLLDMQDEIVSRLSNLLDAQLMAAEARRAESTPHPWLIWSWRVERHYATGAS